MRRFSAQAPALLPPPMKPAAVNPADPSVACGDSSPFMGAYKTCHASPERRGARNAGGGVLKRRIRGLEPMVSEFVDRTGGSNRVQAQPAGSKWQSALPTRLSLPDKLRWGSGGARSGAEPPPARAGNPQGSLRIRRPWPLQSMAANGRRQNRRQQMEPGPARAGSARQSIRKQVLRIRRTQPLQFMAAGFVFYPAVATGSRPCRPAAASGCRHCRPAASGAGHCPARK